MTRIIVIISIFAIPFAWELYVAISGEGRLISPVLQEMGREWNGIVIYVVNVVVGHVWLQPPFSPAKYLNEMSEIFIVVFIGWIIFWVFKAFDETLTPMSNIQVLCLIAFSLFIGAFFWNLAQ